MRCAETGVVLIEVLAATLILATAGLGLAELAGAALQAVATAEARERELGEEERLLAAYTLLSRTDLDRRLGEARVGAYVVSVQRPERTLYRVAVGHAAAERVEDLVTVVFHPEPSHAP